MVDKNILGIKTFIIKTNDYDLNLLSKKFQ